MEERARMMRILPEVLHLTSLTAFVAIGSLLCPGCGPRPVETGPDVSAGYRFDALHARLDYPMAEVFQAADGAVSDLGLTVLADRQDGVAAEIETLDAQRDYITIGLVALPYGQTAMTIRAGLFGNRDKSDVVFERTMENLRGEPAVVKR